jgi:hypothetical protein
VVTSFAAQCGIRSIFVAGLFLEVAACASNASSAGIRDSDPTQRMPPIVIRYERPNLSKGVHLASIEARLDGASISGKTGLVSTGTHLAEVIVRLKQEGAEGVAELKFPLPVTLALPSQLIIVVSGGDQQQRQSSGQATIFAKLEQKPTPYEPKSNNLGLGLNQVTSAPIGVQPTEGNEPTRAVNATQICVSSEGDVVQQDLLVPTVPEFDGHVLDATSLKKYPPLVVDGRNAPFCHMQRNVLQSGK